MPDTDHKVSGTFFNTERRCFYEITYQTDYCFCSRYDLSCNICTDRNACICSGRGAEIQQLYLIAVVLTTAFLILWIYRSVSVPLEKLQRAARNIKEGNLDFEIKAESNDEIGQLCQDFEEMRLRLKAQAEEKVAFDRENKELISNISHDLKTPITAIKGYVEGIMDGVADTPEKMDRYIRTIYNKANEMNLLINELTLYSKIDTNRIPYNFTTISAKDILQIVRRI